MRPRLLEVTVHLTRLTASMLGLALAARLGSRAGMVVAAALLFLEAFACMHDLAHGALGLPRRVNEVALALSGALLLMSGHALRQTHLIHHARALADDDEEGLPARGTFLQALACGPRAALALRVHAFRVAGRRERRWQQVETAADVVLCGALLGSACAPLVIYVLVAMAAQATMSVWAAHVPHNAPAWLTRLAAHFTWTGSPTALSLVYHARHHANPRVPCRLLGAVESRPERAPLASERFGRAPSRPLR